VAVLGAGAWGTALAVALAAGGPVRLWSHRPAQAAELAARRVNGRHLPGVLLPPAVVVTAELEAAVGGCRLVVLAVPVAGVAECCRALAGLGPSALARDVPLALAAKGFERPSGRLLHEVVADCLPGQPIVAISGPTFAAEFARAQPTALVVAAPVRALAEAVAGRLRQPWLRAYSATDLVGVEVAGAIKNVLAIAAGVSDGLGLGANARAALLTRGLAELSRLGVALGGEAATFTGLAGLGDLVLTCTDNQSRNRRFGLALARGLPAAAAAEEVGQVVEGAGSAPLALALAARVGVDLPICREVAAVIAGERSPREALQRLMAREPGAEFVRESL
jgi:glycerol-3-phosphate dehydrogenase (NAD(P)+)